MKNALFAPLCLRASSAPSVSRRRVLLAGAASLIAARPALARRYEGHEFPDSLELEGRRLSLNGVGKRAVAVIKGYLAALYLPQPASSPEAIYAAAGPKKLQILMLLDVSTEEFIKAVEKGVRRNCSEAEQAEIAPSLSQFVTQLRAVGKVRNKDLIELDQLPSQATQIRLNGRAIGAPIAGGAFYTALLKVFLGQRPVDARLKRGLLGGSPD